MQRFSFIDELDSSPTLEGTEATTGYIYFASKRDACIFL